ncbi:MAG: YbbR-like domain-containing protein [Desulfobulbaceae bacterium]|nr:YbbR-like domain-containing protein [Desulfobulbaceae bacterium]
MEKLARETMKRYHWFSNQKWTADWGFKLISLLFALLMWYFVVGEDKIDLTVYVPIEITNLPQNLVIANQYKKQLEVAVSGPRGLVRTISNQRITRPIDLTDAKPGTQIFQNRAEAIHFPRGITIQRIQPANTTLTIDNLLERELPINAVTTGEPAVGFRVVSITAKPSSLSLKAPAEALKVTDFLSTKPVDISGITASLSKQVALDVIPEIEELVGESFITVNVTVKEKMIPREFVGIPIEFHHAGKYSAYRLTPRQVMVKAELPYRLSQTRTKTPRITAMVDAGSLPPGRYELPVTVTPDTPGVTVVEVIPPTITITISPSSPVPKLQGSPSPADRTPEEKP